MRGQDDDVVLADGVLGLDRDAQTLGPFSRFLISPSSEARRGHGRLAECRHAAWVLVEIFDKPRRRVGVEMIQERFVADMDLFPFQYRWHRHDYGELFGIPLEVVGHRQHCLVLVPDEHDLRRLVKEFSVRLSHVEAAEGGERLAGPGERDDHQPTPK